MTYVVWSQVVSDKVTPPQFVLLHILASSPLSDQKTLSERSHFDQSTIADVTRRLVSRGYIRRERDLVDRRRNLLTITEEGLEVLAELRLRTMMMNEIVLGALSLSEQKTFLELGQRVIDATERLIPKAPRRGRMQTFSLVTSEVDSPHLT